MVFEIGLRNGEVVGKDGDHAENFSAGVAHSSCCCEAATTGGDKVFDDENLAALRYAALDLVAHAVVFRFWTNVGKRLMHSICDEGPHGNSSGGDACDNVRLREMRLRERDESVSDFFPSFVIRKD